MRQPVSPAKCGECQPEGLKCPGKRAAVSPRRVFYSKVDGEHLFWSCSTSLVAFAAALFAISSGSLFTLVMAVLLSLIGCLPIWILISTRYMVEESYLHIYCGPFRWALPLASIKTMHATDSPVPSPALSKDRLEIVTIRNRTILVSPKHRQEFSDAIGIERSASL